MRYVVAFIGVVVSVGLIAVSIMMNFRFGQMLGKTELDGIIYGIASGCADGFKVILPFTAAWAWKNNRFLAALVSVTLFVIFSAYSVTSSLGFSARNRAETSGERKQQVAAYQAIRRAYDRAVRQRDALPSFRPISTLQGLLRVQQQHPRWQSTARCSDATVGRSRQFCQSYFTLKAELGTAKQANVLDKRIETYRQQLVQTGAGATLTAVDPQVQLLKDLSGLATNRVELALTILLTLLVECGSGFGLFVTFGHGHCQEQRGGEEDVAATSIKPDEPLLLEYAPSGDREWAMQRLIYDATAHAAMSDLYQDYRLWCQQQDRSDALTLTAFHNWLVGLGFTDTTRHQGRTCIVGVRLKD